MTVHVLSELILYSTFQAVSVPVEVQLTSAVVDPMLETVMSAGLGQVGGVQLEVKVVKVPDVRLVEVKTTSSDGLRTSKEHSVSYEPEFQIKTMGWLSHNVTVSVADEE